MPNILDVYGDKSMRGLVSMLRDYPEFEDIFVLVGNGFQASD